NLGDKVDAAERAKVESAVSDLRTALKGDDRNVIEKKAEALAQASSAIAQRAQAAEAAATADGAGAEAAGAQNGGASAAREDAEESFKEAKEACEVLTDPHKRAAYDQHSHAGVEASGRAGGARGGFSADAFGDIFGDVFGDIFGGARRSGRSQAFRGADLRYELELELPQAVFGHHAEIEVARLAECEVCKGSGAAKGSQPATCDTCGGAGQVRISQGFFQLQQTCPRCRGTGSIVRNPCDTCLGQGRVRRTRKLAVKVPAGVDNGDRV